MLWFGSISMMLWVFDSWFVFIVGCRWKCMVKLVFVFLNCVFCGGESVFLLLMCVLLLVIISIW